MSFEIMSTSDNRVVQGEMFYDAAEVILTTAAQQNVSLLCSIKSHSKIIHYHELRETNSLARYKFRKAKVLFVFGHELEDFFQFAQPLLERAVTVLMHNSDKTIGEEDYLRFGTRVAHVFTQNRIQGTSHPTASIHALPIGIANSCWSHGKQQRVDFLSKFSVLDEWKTRLCYFWFNVETNASERGYCKRQLVNDFEWDTQRDFPSYAAHLLQYRFAICPEGNSPDTHRFWECLYLGVTPIIRREEASGVGRVYNNWLIEKMPVLVVKEWSEVSERLLRENYTFLRQRFTDSFQRSKWDFVLYPREYMHRIEQAVLETSE